MASLYTAISQGKKPRFAVHDRKVYMADGWRPLQVWDGVDSASRDAGIVGPSVQASAWAPTPSTAAGSCTAGVHKFRYRYLNSRTGYVSEPSNEYRTTVAAGAQQLTFAINTSGSGNMIRSTDAKVDRIVVEMTPAGGLTFYKAVEVVQTASSVAVSISDQTLANQTLTWPGRRGEEFGVHLAPPIASHVLAFRGRLFCFGQVVHELGTIALTNGSNAVTGTSTDWTDAVASPITSAFRNRVRRHLQRAGDTESYQISEVTLSTALTLDRNYAGVTGSGLSYKIFSSDNSVYFSEAGFPEAFPANNFFLGPTHGRLRAMVGHLQTLMLFTVNGMERISYDLNPAEGLRSAISHERGAVSQEVVINVEETLYALDRRGVHAYDGGSPEPISRPIESIVARINFAYESKFHCAFYPKLRAVRWWVAVDADTEPKTYLQWDVDRKTWSIGHREVGVTASATVPTDDGVAVLVADENGNTWFDDQGDTDGADGASDAQQLVGSGASTTVVPVRGTLPASPALVGVPVYHEALEQSRVITAHTTSQLTVGVAFSRAPTFDERIHLGRCKAKLRTKAFRVGDRKTQGRYVYVHFVPLATSRLVRLRVYRDFGSSAIEFAGATYTDLKGCTAPGAGETDWQLDVSEQTGVIRVPLGLEAAHASEVELELTDADVPVRILGVSIDGVDLEPVS